MTSRENDLYTPAGLSSAFNLLLVFTDCTLVQEENWPFKVAEHSFRARFCRCNSVRAQGLSQRYVRKGNDAKNPAILSFFSVTERTQLNAAHV